MGARKKRRSRFEYLGRYYHWWFDDAWRVHICSEDKKFVIAYFAGDPFQEPPFDGPLIEVHGLGFPGIDDDEPRPVLLHVPKFVSDEWRKSLGALVNAVIRWSIQESHKLKRLHEQPQRRELT
jgi:hypothetical protein